MNYSDFYSKENLEKIDELFNEFLRDEKFDIDNSASIIESAKIVDKFLIKLFNIQNEIDEYNNSQVYIRRLITFRKEIIHRTALVKYKEEDVDDSSLESFNKLLDQNQEIDKFFINSFGDALDKEVYLKYAAYRVYYGAKSDLFSRPEKLDFSNLIDERKETSKNAHIEASYCIKCHRTEKDSCRKGIKDAGEYKVNPLGNILKGCPLDIKISEMNMAFEDGSIIAALAILMADNPLACLTGHRICNDCSKSCIYQKQEQVDIPLIESQILRDVLRMTYGPEIYSLLARWNPLLKKEFKNKGRVLVVGSGPSGIALSYYLLISGSEVVMVEGLKIEEINFPKIVKEYSEVEEIYNKSKPQGFGGVSEYGITDRWNKENLVLARIILERFPNFKLHGGIKFGANITYKDAKDLGFDHIALCCGSGYPNIPIMQNINAGNVRSASDFLMSVGAGGAKFYETTTNFMIQLPSYVVGGGLTAIDTALQILSYYPILTKKIYSKYKNQNFNTKEKRQLEEFLIHARLFLKEDELSARENRKPDYRKIIDMIGGVSILYRKKMIDSPAYKINHEELQEAINLGVNFVEDTNITNIEVDEYGDISGIEINQGPTKLSAKTLLFATGTKPLNPKEFLSEVSSDISIFGDMDHSYSGSVVKAIASAKDNYKKILDKINSSEAKNYKKIEENIVSEVNFLSDEIYEVKVKNSLISKNFKPGQFFKLHLPKSKTGKIHEPLALTGAYVDGDTISLISQIVGESSSMASELKEGDKICLVGPLGTPSKIYNNSTVLLIGGGVGTAALFEYAKNLKKLEIR